MTEFILQEDPFISEELSKIDEDFPLRGERRSDLSSWQQEFDGYWAEIQKFHSLDPAEIFLRLSALNARASEIRSLITRTDNRRLNAFRTREVEPFLEALEFQFKCHSRLVTFREQELRLSGGQL